MMSTTPDGPPPPGDLTARVFRALYPDALHGSSDQRQP
jgi:hypothetical protein